MSLSATGLYIAPIYLRATLADPLARKIDFNSISVERGLNYGLIVCHEAISAAVMSMCVRDNGINAIIPDAGLKSERPLHNPASLAMLLSFHVDQAHTFWQPLCQNPCILWVHRPVGLLPRSRLLQSVFYHTKLLASIACGISLQDTGR